MSDIFFTSDNHFGHKAVIKYCHRPFADAAEMDEAMVSAWNARVKTGDTVWHLGDVSFHKPLITESVLCRLNGVIHLVKGNHDSKLRSGRFASVQDYKELSIDSKRIVLFHYPMMTWNKGHYGAWHLHGHCHGSLHNHRNTRFDVGVDANSLNPFAPWSLEEIRQEMRSREYEVVDHHE